MLKSTANANQYIITVKLSAYSMMGRCWNFPQKVKKSSKKSKMCGVINGLFKAACELVEESYKWPWSHVREVLLPFHWVILMSMLKFYYVWKQKDAVMNPSSAKWWGTSHGLDCGISEKIVCSLLLLAWLQCHLLPINCFNHWILQSCVFEQATQLSRQYCVSCHG